MIYMWISSIDSSCSVKIYKHPQFRLLLHERRPYVGIFQPILTILISDITLSGNACKFAWNNPKIISPIFFIHDLRDKC